MPDFSIPSSTGVVLTSTQVLSGQNGCNASVGYVWRPVPGQLLQTHGLGQFAVNHIGTRGSLTAEVIVGAAGTARAIMKLTSALANPQDTIQLSLDTSNRPVLTIAYAGGDTITASTASGSAITVGSRVQIRAVWDSVTPLPSGSHVDFKLLSGAAVPGTMGTIPNVPWSTVPMGYVLVGYGANLSDFNGTILNLQVGDQRI
jgi:hypothetical protein